MPEWIDKMIRILVASRFTGSIEIHFKDGVALKVHRQEYVTAPKTSQS